VGCAAEDPAVHYYEPGKGHGLAHDPFLSIIAPRPIGWVSSRDSNGILNLAPYSFFNAFNYSPHIIGFSSIGHKDSVRNIEQSKEFCWNLATFPLAKAMNTTSSMVSPDVDEFALAGLTPLPSRHISAPRVGESPVSFECKVTQIVQLKTIEGKELETWVVFGQVVAVYINKSFLKDGCYDTVAADPIMRAGGSGDYFRIAPDLRFVMPRPGG